MNLFSPESRRNPFPLYDRLRASCPVFEDPHSGACMVFSFEGVKQVISDHESFSSRVTPESKGPGKWFIFFDPPRHSKLRALVMKAFTPKMVVELEERIREISQNVLRDSLSHGEMDFVRHFAIPIPMMVIAEMLGVPANDWPAFRGWSDGMLSLSQTTGGSPEAAQASIQEYKRVTAEMQEYLGPLLDSRRSEPRNDLLSRLVAAEVEGEYLSDQQIMGFFQLLLVAGTETTTNLLSSAVLSLTENPDQLERLCSTPALLPSAVEEVLRFRSPVQWVFRVATRDTVVDGQRVPEGKLVLPMIGSANRDPLHFTEPNRFDIGRNPNPHIAFGHGVHFCLGASLSRLESKVALNEFLSRVRSFERASSEPWELRNALHVYGPASLPIRFELRQAAVPSILD